MGPGANYAYDKHQRSPVKQEQRARVLVCMMLSVMPQAKYQSNNLALAREKASSEQVLVVQSVQYTAPVTVLVMAPATVPVFVEV